MSYRVKLFTALFLVYLIWGSTYLSVHYALAVLPPILLSSIRFGVGGFLWILYMTLTGHKWPTRQQLLGATAIGILLNGIGTTSIAYAIHYIPSGIAALLVAMLPIWIFLLDYLLFSKLKPSVFSGVGLVAGAVGMVFLLNPFNATATEKALPFWPVFILVIGCLAWAYGSLKAVTWPQPPGFQTVGFQMFAGGVFAFLLSLLLEDGQWQAIRQMDSFIYLNMAYLIFIGSYVGYSAYVWLMNNAPPLLTSTYAYVNPVVALILGWLYADEHLSRQSLMASGIILAGVILMTLGRRKVASERK